MPRRHPNRPPALRQSTVMGRSAVAVVVAFWQVPALAYLCGFTASTAISETGSPLVPLVWSVSFLVCGVLMGLVYWLREETDRAIVEVGVLVVFTTAIVVYLLTLWTRASSLEGRIAVLAVLGSLVVNCLGRAALLLRQLWFVHRARSAALA